MRRLLFELRHCSIFLIAIISQISFGARFQVVKRTGDSFSVSKRGETKKIKTGEYVYFGDELLVEESSSISILGKNDVLLHLMGGTHVKLEFENFRLLKGAIWIQSKTKRNGAKVIETSNSLVKFFEGDAIVEYADVKEKTHVFVLSGSAEVSNVYDKFKNVSLNDGEFTFVHKEHDDGRPRLATMIGKESFVTLKTHFRGVSPLKKSGVVELYSPSKRQSQGVGDLNREIASMGVEEVQSVELPEKVHSSQKGLVIISNKMKKKWHLEKNPPPPKPKKIIYPKAPIRIFGIESGEKPKSKPIMGPATVPSRLPASVVEDQSNDFVESIAPRFSEPLEKVPSTPKKNPSNPADSFLDQLRQIEESETEVY